MESSVRLTQQGNHDRVEIIGPINEEAEVHLSKLASSLSKSVLINFKQVTYINSLGVRAWINFMRDLGDRNLVFQECTPEIVNQINMIPNFKGTAKIESVYGTFFCENCNNNQEEIFIAGKNLPTSENFTLPPVKCKSCGADNIEFEEVEDSFFAFSRAG